MRHCSPDELMDVVEGVRTERPLGHLTMCAECRRQVSELRAALAELRDVPVPEPSPVQWARLSARVRAAVASEVERSRSPWWTGWAWLVPVAGAAVLTLALVVPGLYRAQSAKSRPTAMTAAVAGAGADGSGPGDQEPANDVRDDPSLGLMFDLTGVLDLDSDPAPMLAMGEGTLDRAIGDLSPDEQHELARLLQEAIGRPGA
jgi:hypothetical protein